MSTTINNLSPYTKDKGEYKRESMNTEEQERLEQEWFNKGVWFGLLLGFIITTIIIAISSLI